MMDDKELKKFARGFRKGILGDRSSAGYCFMVCSPLVSLLHLNGVEGELVSSNVEVATGSPFVEHYWIKLADGRALDPTFDQFDTTKTTVYLGKPTEFHKL
jgi:hypothetical protein